MAEELYARREPDPGPGTACLEEQRETGAALYFRQENDSDDSHDRYPTPPRCQIDCL